jgi:NAD(P)H dehydrogenase (quinone)
MKKILIIKGHPREDCFCNTLVERYIAGTKANNVEIKILDLRELELEPWLKYDWDRNHNSIPTSEDLERAKKLIAWGDHLVFAYPTYWAMPPALLTLFIEMIIVSGFAFKYHKPLFGGIPQWDRLLRGRTATILPTMDSPPIFMALHDQDPGGKMMRDVLRFTGVKLKKKYYFGSVVLSTEEHRKKWLDKAYVIGRKDSH